MITSQIHFPDSNFGRNQILQLNQCLIWWSAKIAKSLISLKFIFEIGSNKNSDPFCRV
jgi:hypothetical protein